MEIHLKLLRKKCFVVKIITFSLTVIWEALALIALQQNLCLTRYSSCDDREPSSPLESGTGLSEY